MITSRQMFDYQTDMGKINFTEFLCFACKTKLKLDQDDKWCITTPSGFYLHYCDTCWRGLAGDLLDVGDL